MLREQFRLCKPIRVMNSSENHQRTTTLPRHSKAPTNRSLTLTGIHLGIFQVKQIPNHQYTRALYFLISADYPIPLSTSQFTRPVRLSSRTKLSGPSADPVKLLGDCGPTTPVPPPNSQTDVRAHIPPTRRALERSDSSTTWPKLLGYASPKTHPAIPQTPTARPSLPLYPTQVSLAAWPRLVRSSRLGLASHRLSL